MLQEVNIKPQITAIFGRDYIPPDIRIICSLQSLIEEHFREERDLEFYSRHLNVTLNRLNMLTRALLGHTVYELLQARLHEEAVKLLQYTTLSVKEIAFELGMSDPAYFFRCFKRITGIAPREFRQQLGNHKSTIRRSINERTHGPPAD